MIDYDTWLWSPHDSRSNDEALYYNYLEEMDKLPEEKKIDFETWIDDIQTRSF